MFENQVADYIGKALAEEASTDGQFLTEAELAFRVTGLMYADKIKSDGPVSLRSIKGKMQKVRQMCDEMSLLLLGKMSDAAEGEDSVMTWKIATPADVDYIVATYLTPGGTDEEPVADEQPAPEATDDGAE